MFTVKEYEKEWDMDLFTNTLSTESSRKVNQVWCNSFTYFYVRATL